MSDGYVTIDVEANTKSFEKQIDEVEARLEEIDLMLSSPKEFNLTESDITKLNVEAEKLNNKLTIMRKKQEEIDNAGLSKMRASLDKVGTSLGGIIKKVTKWGLAVFGVRAAYNFVRQSVSILSSQNEQMAADIEYIRYALASTLQPVIEFIIKLVYQLLSLIGSIVKTLTGKNIFENANKGLDQANKSAKELKKQLAGFDEMNVLTDSSSDASGGTIKPSFDLSDLENADISGIYTWIDKVKGVFDTGFEKIKENVKKVMGDLGFSKEFIGAWEFAVDGVKIAFDGLLDAIGGILEIIIGLVTGDTEKVKEGISKLVKGIGEMLWGLLKNIIGIFGMMVASLYDLIIKPFIEGVKVLIKKIGELLKGLWDGIKSGFSSAINFIKNIFNSVVNFFKNIISTIVGLFKSIGTKVGDVIGGAFKAVINGVLSAIENILNFPIKTINKLINTINKIPGINIGKLSTFNLPRLAKGGIVNMPGRGVPIGGAIAGEAGREAVLPLQDSQVLSEIADAIGRRITINANITNTMNGRVISRELQKINNESDFAFNR